jgi:prepilin-type N-terminal cleavage/methylation domain-containing protein
VNDGVNGFTLIELLITIIAAGLFFAAMVPVFVMATQQSSTDRARILATNTVQSAIERLRDIPYDDLLGTEWSDPAQAAAMLGLENLQWKGPNSDLSVTVATHPEGTAKGSEDYLIATVTADWVGEGGHPHSTSMKTAIYRQGLGTETLVLLVYPLLNGFIKDTPVTVSAQLNAADAAQTKRIDFTVYANNGTQIEEWSVYNPDSYNASVDPSGAELAVHVAGDPVWYFNHQWQAMTSDGQALADGRYSFVAKTVPIPPPDPSDPVPPSEWASKEYVLDRDVPGQPEILACLAGMHAPSPGATPQPFVYLNWVLDPNISDLDHFEIGRTGTLNGSALPEEIITLPKWSLEYVDRDVVTGATYAYKVIAQDEQGQRGVWSDGSTISLSDTALDHVPLAPLSGSIVYTISGRSVTCAWGASPSAAAVDAYRLYRQGADGVRLLVQTVPVALGSTDPLALQFTDIYVEYGATYTYFVTAVSQQIDGLQWESASTSGAPVRVPEPPKVGMRVDVQVQTGVEVPKSARLMIHSLDTGDIIPANPWDYPTIDPGSSNVNKNTWVTGDILYPGAYEVIAIFYAQNNTVLGTYTSERVDVSSSDTPVHMPYSGPN